MNENESKYDDLTVITGIASTRQTWLRERMNMETYQNLADLSVAEISAQLKKDGKGVAKSAIKVWLEEAAELALGVSDVVEDLEIETNPASIFAEANTPRKRSDWKELANFSVFFEARVQDGQLEKRIKVVHFNDGGKAKEWSGLTVEPFDWMLKQAGEGPIPQPDKEDKPRPEDEKPVEETRVEVTQIRLFQPPDDKKPLVTSNGKPVSQELRAGEPFALEVLFSVGGEGAQSLAKKRTKYHVRAVAAEVNTKAGTILGDSEPEALAEGIRDYSVRTPEAKLDTGEHRLWAMVTVQAAGAVPNFLEGPSVRVV